MKKIVEFDGMKRNELEAAVEVDVRAYENYVYFTNYFPEREERIKAIRDMNHCALQTVFGRTNLLVAKQKGRVVAIVVLDPPGYQVPSIENVFDLGVPGPSGNENDTYFSDDCVYKVNNLLNCGSILRLLDKVKIHNEIFPDTFYQLYAFTGFDGRTVMPVLTSLFIALLFSKAPDKYPCWIAASKNRKCFVGNTIT